MAWHSQSGPTYLMRPRRSISISRIATRPSDYQYLEGPRVRATSAEPRYTTYTSGMRPVTVVGSRYHHYTPYYYHRYYPRYYTYETYYPSTATYYSDYPFYTTSAYKYWPYTSSAHYSHYLPSTTYYTRSNSSVYDYTLPTSGLRASVPSWVHALVFFLLMFIYSLCCPVFIPHLHSEAIPVHECDGVYVITRSRIINSGCLLATFQD